MNQRSVVIEFDSVEEAIRTYESPEYQAALKVLEGAVERDVANLVVCFLSFPVKT